MASVASISELLQEIHADFEERIAEILMYTAVVALGQEELRKHTIKSAKKQGVTARAIDVIQLSLQMECIYLMVVMEEMFRSYVAHYYSYVPKAMNKIGNRDEKVLSYEKILKCENLDEVQDKIADKETRRFQGNIDDVEKFFNRLFEVSLSEVFADWLEIRRLYYYRNLIVHAHAIMSKEIYSKIGGETAVGELIQIQHEDIDTACNALFKLNTHVHNVVAGKLKLDKL